MDRNRDESVVADFGNEWTRFDQSELDEAELNRMFNNYFDIFPWKDVPKNGVGFDLGCGSGRWAKLVAPRVGKLHLIDPSDALNAAKNNLAEFNNCEFHNAGVDDMPIGDESCDFGYSLGVLHHIPDTGAGLRSCVSKLKPGAPFLLYLYYNFDNRPRWFRLIWMGADAIRRLVCVMPNRTKYVVTQIIAGAVYLPLARTSLVLEMLGVDVARIPLSQYRRNSFYTMRTDALDRFGTRLEKRFSKVEIRELMLKAGLERIVFSERSFWTAMGYKV
ncbi:MAG: class I SAM-dependent methyltransferase [Pyrinomonadaceae bacterium]